MHIIVLQHTESQGLQRQAIKATFHRVASLCSDRLWGSESQFEEDYTNPVTI